jgi:hypothetical protein
MEAANPDTRPEEQPTGAHAGQEQAAPKLRAGHDATEPARSNDTQLRLIPPTEGGTWRLSGSTREVGRRGVAEARAALRAARRKDAERRRPSAA